MWDFLQIHKTLQFAEDLTEEFELDTLPDDARNRLTLCLSSLKSTSGTFS
jgi:hypothetical protein